MVTYINSRQSALQGCIATSQGNERRNNDSYKRDRDDVISNIHKYFRNYLKTGEAIITLLDEGIKMLKLCTLALEASREKKAIIP